MPLSILDTDLYFQVMVPQSYISLLLNSLRPSDNLILKLHVISDNNIIFFISFITHALSINRNDFHW